MFNKSIPSTSLEEQRKAGSFVQQLQSEATKGGTFDSAAAVSIATEALSQSGSDMPGQFAAILDDCGSDRAKAEAVEALLDGAAEYKARHGKDAPADLLLNAMHVGYSLTAGVRKGLNVALDSATQDAHDSQSLHPSSPAIGMMSAIAMAMPFAAYTAADMKSNEGRIIIVSNQAAKSVGAYLAGASIDGIASGEPYLGSHRALKTTVSGAGNDRYTGQFRSRMTDHETADAGSDPVKVLRGRSVVYVNGIPVARDAATGNSANSPFSGTATIGGSEYAISGTITVATGAFDVVTTPALPVSARTNVVVEAHIDFENGQEALAARFGVLAETFKVFANPDRGIITASIDSQTQFELETGYSPLTVGSEAARKQYYNERHIRALRALKRIAVANDNTDTFDFQWDTHGAQKSRAQIWADFSAVLMKVSQKMAEQTVSHGVTHLYVSRNVAVQMAGLPSEIFQASGLTAQPGIYRVGRLFGTFEVYYVPKSDIVPETADTGSILCIGTSATTARNPIVAGDAVAPMFTPRGVLDDMKQGFNFYTRGFTEVNPHKPSALGAAFITVTNLF